MFVWFSNRLWGQIYVCFCFFYFFALPTKKYKYDPYNTVPRSNLKNQETQTSLTAVSWHHRTAPGSGRISTILSGSTQLPDWQLVMEISTWLRAEASCSCLLSSPAPQWAPETQSGEQRLALTILHSKGTINWDQQSCDPLVFWLKAGRVQLQHQSNVVEMSMYVCVLYTPYVIFKSLLSIQFIRNYTENSSWYVLFLGPSEFSTDKVWWSK